VGRARSGGSSASHSAALSSHIVTIEPERPPGPGSRSRDRLVDISPPISAASPVFPGDAPFSLAWTATLGPGSPVNLSAVSLSPHTGAHADAPLHYSADGEPIDLLDLDVFVGRCRVVHALGAGELVAWTDIEHALPDHGGERVDVRRILVRTYERAPVDAWDPRLKGLEPALIERLAETGVVLIGTDAASVDRADSKDLPSHRTALRHDVRLLENLVLDHVPEGDYELIALPLRIVGADASPVRAVLRRWRA